MSCDWLYQTHHDRMAKYVDAFSPDLTGAGYSPMKEKQDYSANCAVDEQWIYLTMFYWLTAGLIATLSRHTI
jgi:hypothetical protein